MNQYKNFSDNKLIQKISRYDSRALEELYDRYSPVLFTLIKKIAPDKITAENILVEVFTIIWRKIDFYDFKKDSPYTWLILLSRNRAVDSIRRDRVSAATLEFYDDNFEDRFVIPKLAHKIDSLDLLTALKIKPDIQRALENLTDAQKYIIHLSFYEGYTIDEIKNKLNIPIETVRTKILTAVYNLRDNLISQKSEFPLRDQDIFEMICAYAVGCMDRENFLQFSEYLEKGGELPPGELGQLQNTIALIPTILESEKPNAELKNRIAKKLAALQDEIKEKIKAQKRASMEKLKTKGSGTATESKPVFPELHPTDILAEMTETELKPEKNNVASADRQQAGGKLNQHKKRTIREKAGFWKRFGGWVTAVLLLVVLGLLYFLSNSINNALNSKVAVLQNEVSTLKNELISSKQSLDEYNTLLNFLKSGNIISVNLTGTKPFKNSSGKLLFSFEKGEIILQLNNLPIPPVGKVYHLWMISRGKSLSLGSFIPKPNNKYLLFNGIPRLPANNIDLFRITEEPEGSTIPQGRTCLYGTLR